MRIYSNCFDLMSEIARDLWEMGILVHPITMQNKFVGDDKDFVTKEIINYSYCLMGLGKVDALFNLTNPNVRAWADAEFDERVSMATTLNPGEAYLLRENIWKEFLNDQGEFDYTYHDRIKPFTNLMTIIRELVKNPDTRQAIIGIWYPNIDTARIGNATHRIPCSLNYQVLIRENKVHLIYNQRSADFITHFGNDIYLALKMKDFITYQLNLFLTIDGSLEAGYLYHNIASIHAYKKDWNTLTNFLNKQ